MSPLTVDYSGPEKEKYRQQVWDDFFDVLQCTYSSERSAIAPSINERGPVISSISSAQALILSTTDGLEIEHALNRGIRQENLHVVNLSPAVVATLKKRYPKINTYGVDLGKVLLEKRITPGTLHLANVDLCGILSWKWCATVYLVANSLVHGGALAATFQNGRDTPNLDGLRWVKSNKETPVSDVREAIALSTMGMCKELTSSNTYVSNTVPMRWYSGCTVFPNPDPGVHRYKDQFKTVATELALGFTNGWKNIHPKVIDKFVDNPFSMKWDYLKKTFGTAK
jgi:hypothetical protein